MSERAVAPTTCLVCQLPPAIKQELHEKLLGDPGDAAADPPRLPVGGLSTEKTSKWLLETHKLTIGYRSIGRHRASHIVFLPPVKPAPNPPAPVFGGNAVTVAANAADPVVAAHVAQTVADTSRIDEAAEILMGLFRTVGGAVTRRQTHAAASRLGQPQSAAAQNLFKGVDESLTITKAESDFFTGGMGALAQLEKVKFAVGLGVPGARGKVGEALAVTAGVKGLVFGSPPPPIDGDEPDEDDEEAPAPAAANAPVIDVQAEVVSAPVQAPSGPTPPVVVGPGPAAAPLRSITGGAGKIGLWNPPPKKSSVL